MNRISHDRNGTLVFAERVQRNLEFIVAAAAAGEKVHPVTHAVSSLLGIIVFPWEFSAFDSVKRKKLPVLTAQDGWPRWTMNGPRRVLEVGELVQVLRNSTAHGSIEFDSDSGSPADVRITFTNVPEGKREPDWNGSIQADELIRFCHCFANAIRSHAA